jgi:hypothetical protein
MFPLLPHVHPPCADAASSDYGQHLEISRARHPCNHTAEDPCRGAHLEADVGFLKIFDAAARNQLVRARLPGLSDRSPRIRPVFQARSPCCRHLAPRDPGARRTRGPRPPADGGYRRSRALCHDACSRWSSQPIALAWHGHRLNASPLNCSFALPARVAARPEQSFPSQGCPSWVDSCHGGFMGCGNSHHRRQRGDQGFQEIETTYSQSD